MCVCVCVCVCEHACNSCHSSLPLPRITRHCHDDAARFVKLLATDGRSFLTELDFEPIIQVKRAPQIVNNFVIGNSC